MRWRGHGELDHRLSSICSFKKAEDNGRVVIQEVSKGF